MKVICFEPDYDEKHRNILRAFAEGIPGATVRPLKEYEPCDVAVIFGAVKRAFKPTWAKQNILDRHQGRSLIMIESAFIKRGQYYQIGWGGYAGNADFNFDGGFTMDRWNAIGAKAKPWTYRSRGPIVVCGQLPRDTQVQEMDHERWCRETVEYYDKRGEYVVFRPHPKVVSFTDYRVDNKFIDTQPLDRVLKIARAFVTWNSTSAVDAIVAGVPAVAMDPSSFSYEVAGHTLDDLEQRPDRFDWFKKLSFAQWTIEEMKAGKPWQHLISKY